MIWRHAELQSLLREKALNTGELLKQHRDLQQKYQMAAEELGRERSARENAGEEVQAAQQALSATNK